MAVSEEKQVPISFDAYAPREMAYKAENIGVAKVRQSFLSMFMLALLAGGFIAFGGCLYTTAIIGNEAGLGINRLVGGLSFCLGLIMVVIAGAELFTGNSLIVIAYISGKVRFRQVMRNWGIVYLGNLFGAVAVAVLVYGAGQWKSWEMAAGISAYNIAATKLSVSFLPAFCSDVLCNSLVCLAVWLCYSARSTTDKILSILFPITAFVALGFEHCVANMYFIPYGLMLAKTSSFVGAAEVAGQIRQVDPVLFSIGNFLLNNLLPVTLGNIVGGSVLVGALYWTIYLRRERTVLGGRLPANPFVRKS